MKKLGFIRLIIALPEKLLKDLDKGAAKEGCSRTEFIRKVLREYFQK